MESITGNSKNLSNLNNQDSGSKKVGLAVILVPIFCVLFALLALGEFLRRRKQNHIIVELEETDNMMHNKSRGNDTRGMNQNDDDLFPVPSEDPNYLPDLDCMCGKPIN